MTGITHRSLVDRRPLRVHGPLWVVLAVALAIRAAIVVATPGYAPFGDPADYDRIARFLQHFGTYPPSTFADPTGAAALRPPGYPYLLAGVYDVLGVHWQVARLVGGVLGTVAVALLWGIVRRVWDARLALWSAGIAAVLPSLVWVGGGLTAESLFVPLLLGAVWAAVRHRDAPHARWVAAAGVLLGLAVLTRTNGAIAVLPLLAAAWLPRRRWSDPVVLLVGLALALAPWTVRNAAVFGSFSPLGTQSGFTLAGAYNPESAQPGPYRAAWRVPMDVPSLQVVFHRPGTDEAAVDADLRDRALRFAWDHPGFVVSATVIHARQLLHLTTATERASGGSFREMGMPRWTWGPSVAAFLVLLAAAIAGAVLLVRRGRDRGPLWLWLVPVVLFLGVVPLLGPPRYRIPVDPFLAILAAVALLAVRDRVAARRAARRAARG
ncbi:glycosyltransferase family 39 protein [Patulibacter sp. NPDC049589]|uniref:glycosyltransferase family 39 protein n=1 Tax=Patulibacter sp. NPDC049589 TaxID=3154731 RepID=UPI003437F50A